VALQRGRPLPTQVRAVAAAMTPMALILALTPALALLTPGSASLWLFPVIAAVAGASSLTGCSLAPRQGAGQSAASRFPAAGAVAGALQISGAGIGLATILLALAWPVTGAQTVFASAAVLTAGAAATSWILGRGPGALFGWWYTALMACVALWSALVWGEVGLVEAYSLPPALAAVLVGGWASKRRPRFTGLVAAGGVLAVTPPLLALLASGDQLARALELVVLGSAALVGASVFGRLRGALVAAGVIAATGVLFAGVMIGQLSLDGWHWFEEFRSLAPYPSAMFAIAAGWGLLAAAGYAAAGRLILVGGPGERWWSMPALAAAAVVPCVSVRFTWPVVGALWAAMAAYLALTVLAAAAERREEPRRPVKNRPPRPRTLLAFRIFAAQRSADRVRHGRSVAIHHAPSRLRMPSVWAIWPIAVALGIAGWSPRELRVECFALPLGLALFAAGMILARRAVGDRAADGLVAPGVAATLGPSTLAVGTDPLTWRAIMVLVAALAFMMLGARRHWRGSVGIAAASMITSLVLVLIRHGDISILPWLLALLAVGGSLFALALVFERRARRAPPGG
jgi:hypothetical protein